jgi:hypothetical protein
MGTESKASSVPQGRSVAGRSRDGSLQPCRRVGKRRERVGKAEARSRPVGKGRDPRNDAERGPDACLKGRQWRVQIPPSPPAEKPRDPLFFTGIAGLSSLLNRAVGKKSGRTIPDVNSASVLPMFSARRSAALQLRGSEQAVCVSVEPYRSLRQPCAQALADRILDVVWSVAEGCAGSRSQGRWRRGTSG